MKERKDEERRRSQVAEYINNMFNEQFCVPAYVVDID
jgi:hypothetical protein